MLYSHWDPVYICLKKNDGDIAFFLTEKLNDFRNDGFFFARRMQCTIKLSAGKIGISPSSGTVLNRSQSVKIKF